MEADHYEIEVMAPELILVGNNEVKSKIFRQDSPGFTISTQRREICLSVGALIESPAGNQALVSHFFVGEETKHEEALSQAIELQDFKTRGLVFVHSYPTITPYTENELRKFTRNLRHIFRKPCVIWHVPFSIGGVSTPEGNRNKIRYENDQNLLQLYLRITNQHEIEFGVTGTDLKLSVK